jgi:hypothetical protein
MGNRIGLHAGGAKCPNILGRPSGAQLVAAPISGDYPWSTYAQDAIICTDGGLAAASVSDSPKWELIYYALEPLICSLESRDVEVIRTYGNGYWGRKSLRIQ